MSYGIDTPKPIERFDAATRAQDALTDLIHVIADDRQLSIEAATRYVEDRLSGLLQSASYHARAEAEPDDLCPAGVEVVPARDPNATRITL